MQSWKIWDKWQIIPILILVADTLGIARIIERGRGGKAQITGNDVIKIFERRNFLWGKDTVEWKIKFKQKLDYLGTMTNVIAFLDCPAEDKSKKSFVVLCLLLLYHH